jgi:hypothetical protein
MWSWQVAVAFWGSVRPPVDHHATGAADPLAAVALECHRLLTGGVQLLVQQVEHLEERGIGADGLVVDVETARLVGAVLAPHPEGDADGLAVSSAHVVVFPSGPRYPVALRPSG